MARADVFKFTDRWAQFRSLFNEKPDLDINLTRLEQRDQQLEKFVGDLWNPAMQTYTPNFTNVSNSMGVFTYQIINASLVYIEGFIGPPPLHPGPYPTVTATDFVTVSLPFPCDAGGFWGSVQLPFPVGLSSGSGGGMSSAFVGKLEYPLSTLSISQSNSAALVAGTALSGLGWAGVYRAIVQ